MVLLVWGLFASVSLGLEAESNHLQDGRHNKSRTRYVQKRAPLRVASSFIFQAPPQGCLLTGTTQAHKPHLYPRFARTPSGEVRVLMKVSVDMDRAVRRALVSSPSGHHGRRGLSDRA